MRIEKFNEFINEGEIYSLIEKAKSTNSSDPLAISKRESYRKIVDMGDRIIPFLIEDGSYIWNIALKELTNVEPVGEKSSEVLEFWKKWAIENGYKK